MTSYDDADRQMHADWNGYRSVDPHYSSSPLPNSPPPLCYPHPPNAVPYYQDLRPARVPGIRTPLSQRNYRHAAQPHAVHHRESIPPTAIPATTAWIPYEPGNQRPSAPRYEDYDLVQRQDLNRITLPLDNVSEPPQLPGAARYLQRRESQNVPVPNTTCSLTATPSASTVRTHHNERARFERTATAHSPQRPSKIIKPATYDMDDQSPRSRQASSKRHAYTSSPSCGTEHAPLEILSSPEPDPKHRKITNATQAAQPKPRETSKSMNPASYDVSSRQETTKMLAESTDVKPRKTRYYAVAVGRERGVYMDWPTVEKLTTGFPGAKHKKFKTEEEALAYVEKYKGYFEKLSGLSASDNLVPTMPGYEQYSRLHQHSARTQPITCDELSFGLSSVAPPPSQHMSYLEQGKPAVSELGEDFIPMAVDVDPVLVPEQQKVVDLIIQGHNVFYTGSAGCGKSTILKAFVKKLEEKNRRVKIIAPTNLAALNVGGQTTWNFAGWTPDSMKKSSKELMKGAQGKSVFKRLTSVDVLVIDEISMIENLQFERLNMLMKEARGKGPFGGVQIVVTGDFHQLSPVKPFQHCIGCGWELRRDNERTPSEYRCEKRDCREDVFYDIDKWAFRSKAWEECNFKYVNLTQIHRQSDMMFKSILNRIRTDGIILKPHAAVLLKHTSETDGAIELYALRKDVDRVNNMNIAKLPSEARSYKCIDYFKWAHNHEDDRTMERNTFRFPDGTLTALKEHRFETQVQMKDGQRVVLQANIDPTGGLVNGAQGTIIDFEPYDKDRLPKAPKDKTADGELRGDHANYREEQIKSFAKANGEQPWPVVKFLNGRVMTIMADCTVNELGNEKPYSLLSRTQIPLAAGYAITVHKSQGMTLDRVIVDLARAFETSQIYVALSRARSLKGLTVKALPRYELGGANAQVKEFMQKFLAQK